MLFEHKPEQVGCLVDAAVRKVVLTREGVMEKRAKGI
jgi:hypothetical protein